MKPIMLLLICFIIYGDVAQLARAFGSYPKGRGFDSLRRYQMDIKLELSSIGKTVL